MLILSPLLVQGQWHDFTWLIGYTTANPPAQGDLDGITRISFKNGFFEAVEIVDLDYEFTDNNASFSDSSGNLIAYFNGIDIENSSFNVMENGQGMDGYIVPGPTYRKYSDEDLPQGSIFLPWPMHPDSIVLLYGGLANYGTAAYVILGSLNLSYAVIDIKANNGLGKVVEREQPLLEDTIGNGQITACKHANGRDWWVLVWEANANRVYRFLINPKGISLKGQQTVDFPVYSGLGQSCFSPDGRFYASYNAISDSLGSKLDLFEFERCNGLLSNQLQVWHPLTYAGGVSFSPDSRFLYENNYDTVYQYDLHAADIIGSQKIAAIRDDFPYPMRFYLSQLAPDDKIYTSATNGSKWLHVIHRPDEEGAACQYEQRGILLPTVNSFSVPNFPNYRLGPLDGSLCDTLGLDNLPVAWFRYEQDTLDPNIFEFRDLSYYEPATWSWDFGDGTGSTERHPIHTYSNSGSYQVCLTVSNDIGSNTHCKTVQLTVSATQPAWVERIKVGPSPFRERLAVSLSVQLLSPVFRLYDMTGRPVGEERLTFGINETDTGGLPPGMYFWEVTTGNERVKSGKVVKAEW